MFPRYCFFLSFRLFCTLHYRTLILTNSFVARFTFAVLDNVSLESMFHVFPHLYFLKKKKKKSGMIKVTQAMKHFICLTTFYEYSRPGVEVPPSIIFKPTTSQIRNLLYNFIKKSCNLIDF